MSQKFVNGHRGSSSLESLNPILTYGLSASALVLLLSVSRAYNTDALTTLHRLTLWSISIGLIIGQTVILDHMSHKVFGQPSAKSPFLFVCVLLIVTILMTFELHGLKFTPLLPKAPEPLWDFFIFLIIPVSVISGCTLFYRRIINLNDGPKTISRADDYIDSDRVETSTRNWRSMDVLAVKSNDHYLEIWTISGHHFVKGRMKDAVFSLCSSKGIQVHRSWWVAFDVIQGMEKQGRDWKVKTQFGFDIPVSRSRLSEVKRLAQLNGFQP